MKYITPATLSRIVLEILVAIMFSRLFGYLKQDEQDLDFDFEINELSESEQARLSEIAAKLVAEGKGILAADESTGTMGKRFAKVDMQNTENNRRKYREMLFRTPNISKYISGIILYEETLQQKTSDGELLINLIERQGIIPGIKLDLGLSPLKDSPKETFTKGLDGLLERAVMFKEKGCLFAKWRCTFRISEDKPTHKALLANSRALAQYASIAQRTGLVPIIEPEVLADGTHDIGKAQKTVEKVLSYVYKAMHDNGIFLEGTLLKTSMVIPGLSFPGNVSHETVARKTIEALRRTVPPAVSGIVFLSGGQSENDATTNLDRINRDISSNPWTLTFSFGRALQSSALKAWKLQEIGKAQRLFLLRAEANSLASLGNYAGSSIHS